ncbi:MAG: hypothetical protein HYX34_02380 [Actinobacteria bacterium]|nr:hypothetical protein [Actinomycetota bacterium]
MPGADRRGEGMGQEGRDGGAPPEGSAADSGVTDPGGFSRRRFLAGIGAASAWTLGEVQGAGPAGALTKAARLALPGIGSAGPKKTFTASMKRRLDQLRLTLEFWNLQVVDQGSGAVLVRADLTISATYIIVVFPPQHLFERAFFNTAGPGWGDVGDEPPAAPPVGGRMAGPTRLAFSVPASLLPMPYTVDALLDWLAFSPRVVPNAVGRNPRAFPSNLRPPALTETAIELPWRVQLSPPANQAWGHALDPVTRNGRTELWHTRLGVRRATGGNDVVDESAAADKVVRAIWSTQPGFKDFATLGPELESPPYDQLLQNIPFRGAMTNRDRLDLVRLSADFTLRGGTYKPPPVDVDRLALSSLGGLLDSAFATDLPPSRTPGSADYQSDLVAWRHIAALGRDGYVRVVRKGWLFPFGFKAVQVVVTQRIFVGPGGSLVSNPGAYLQQQMFIAVTQPRRDYPGSFRIPWSGRGLPFNRLDCLTQITPPIDDPSLSPAYASGIPPQEAFQVRSGGLPFRFHLRGADWAGETHDLRAMAVFVADTRAYNEANVQPIIDTYNGGNTADQNTAVANPSGLDGAKLHYASAKQAGDTAFITRNVVFRATLPALIEGGVPATAADGDNPVPSEFSTRTLPRFYPALRTTDIEFSEAASAGGAGSPGPGTFGYFSVYLQKGFPSPTATPTEFAAHPNKGAVFLSVPPSTGRTFLATATRKAGGMAAPALSIEAVSRELGPTGDPANISKGDFQPANVIPSSVKLLGGIALVEVLDVLAKFLEGGTEAEREQSKKKALKITNKRLTDPDRVETTIDWEPGLSAGPPSLNLFVPGANASCQINIVVVTNLEDPAKSTFDISGKLKDFRILLFGGNAPGGFPEDPEAYASGSTFIQVPVDEMAFQAGSTKKEQLSCDLGTITFHGPLKFVEKLAEAMSFGGGSGLKIDIDGKGITVTLKIALPNITLGVMSITNIAVIVELVIPFDGTAVELAFRLCTRDNPFTLTVLIFGGGGFVGVTVSIKGVEMLEFSFEFGAGYSLDVGIASGKVEVKAGIYFKLETLTDGVTQQVTLEAFIRMAGRLDVLGLITISIEMYLKLIYTKTGSTETLEGEASIKIEVKLIFFSIGTEVKVRKTLSKSGGGGGFAPVAPSAAEQAQPSTATSSDHAPALPSGVASPYAFADNYTKPQWESYCDAFAPVGA